MRFTPFDLKRLESYANNMLDYHVVLDLMPSVADLYFQKRLGSGSGRSAEAQASEGPVKLTAVQSSILLAIGLQRKTLEDLESELQIPASQTLALFVKMIRKISKRLIDIRKAAIEAEMPQANAAVASFAQPSSRLEGGVAVESEGVATSMLEELDQAGNEVTSVLRERQKEMLSSLDLTK